MTAPIVSPQVESMSEQRPVPVKPTEESSKRDEAYDQIDRFLRNNMDDEDYADYSQALQVVWGAAAPTRRIVACVNACAGIPTDVLEDKSILKASAEIMQQLAAAQAEVARLNRYIDSMATIDANRPAPGVKA